MRLTLKKHYNKYSFRKDGTHLAYISASLIKDLKELHGIEVYDELRNALRYECDDLSLDTEVEIIISQLKDLNLDEEEKSMTINDYQNKAIATAIYGEGQSIIYPTLGLAGEAGEVADKVKKVLRDNDGKFTDEKKLEIAKEIGDVCWYIAALCRDLGFSMDEVCQMNIDKLASRQARNVISGSGDDR